MRAHKIIMAAGLLLASAAAQALPQGSWSGTGEWTANSGESQAYTHSVTISGDKLSGSWTYEGQEVPFSFTVAEKGKFFQVVTGKTVVGSGYCYGVQCHYSAVFGDAGQVEETYTFVEGKLYVLGSKTYEQGKAIWAADLNPKK